MIPICLLHDNRFPAYEQAALAAGTRSETFGGPVGPYDMQQCPRELAALAVLLDREGKRGGHYLEIGCASGGTARWLGEQLEFRSLTLIDKTRNEQAVNRLAHLPAVWFWDDSRSKLTREFVQTGPPADVVLIDGDHRYRAVRKDFALAARHAAPDAMFVFHDIRPMTRFEDLGDPSSDIRPVDIDPQFHGGPARFFRYSRHIEQVAEIIDENLRYMAFYSCGLGVARRK